MQRWQILCEFISKHMDIPSSDIGASTDLNELRIDVDNFVEFLIDNRLVFESEYAEYSYTFCKDENIGARISDITTMSEIAEMIIEYK